MKPKNLRRIAMKLSDLFDIKYGLKAVDLNVHKDNSGSRIPLIRPSKTQKGTIAGYIERSELSEDDIFPPETLFVSCDGDGSHTYAYVSDFDFVQNSNVAVLIPKEEMSLQKKMFFSVCITKNRFRFSYGRKPRGDRLKDINLPNPPKWINESFNKCRIDLSASLLKSQTETIETATWKLFPLTYLFDIKKGKRLTKQEMTPGNTPFIGAVNKNNGETARIGQNPIHEANVITVAYDGSVGETFYQEEDFWCSDSVNVLYPKFNINKYIGLFICAILRKEAHRFNYGRKWHVDRMENTTIKLPITKQGNPDFDYMERYIKQFVLV